MCAVPEGLTAEEHENYHREREEQCFTLNLGEASIRDGDGD